MSRTIQRAAVTGAGGFIGSHLVEFLLRQDVEVVAIVRPKSSGVDGCLTNIPLPLRPGLSILQVDILDRASLSNALHGCDTVFHLAAQISVPDSVAAAELHLLTNTMGTFNTLCAAEESAVERVVVVSSSEVYGGSDLSLNESSMLTARSPYSASKIAAEKLAQAFYFSRSSPAVVVRPFNTFGPRQSDRALIPWIFYQAMLEKSIELGNTKPIRDFVFVSDTVQGLYSAATADEAAGKVYNLATGIGWSVTQIVEQVGLTLGRKLEIFVNQDRIRTSKYEVWTLIGDSAAAKRDLFWEPKVGFGSGLAQMRDWLLWKKGCV